MANHELSHLVEIDGVALAAVPAGIAARGGPDVALLALSEGARTAAVFTRNAFCAAPVTVARRHLGETAPHYLLVNAGNANAGLGPQGIEDAEACCRALAAAAGCRPEQVLPFSTGVIGERLPAAVLTAALPKALATLSPGAWSEAARAIMTTDAYPKGSSRSIALADAEARITGIAKGAGMIRPDMATMLAFIATDMAVEPAVLQACLKQAVSATFNRITVDGDTSTNDACVLVATGAWAGPVIDQAEGEAFERLCEVVTEVCQDLALAIVSDGEGATKRMTIEVEGAPDDDTATRVAYAVAESPLVKTAFFGQDPNWGRIMAAVGRSAGPQLDPAGVAIFIDELCIAEGGMRCERYDESLAQEVMGRDAVVVRIVLGKGPGAVRVWTCDLSYDYVRINAEYRT